MGAVAAVGALFPTSYNFNSRFSSTFPSAAGGGGVNVPGISLAAVDKPASTVYMSDAGANPTTGAPTTWTDEATCWILDEEPAATPSGNRCGPLSRHLETTVTGFADGHVKSMRAQQWYSTNSPWLNPAVGG